MLETEGNIWEHVTEAIVITTNGVIKSDGCAVMGRGIALGAAIKWPALPLMLGQALGREGNHVHIFEFDHISVLTMPTKSHWREASYMGLIERSAHELVATANEFLLHEIVLPRAGCGNGQLRWTEVSPVLEDILDDRFTVVYQRA